MLAGMWEFATGNTFGATAFSSYGAFWLSYGKFAPMYEAMGRALTALALAFIISPWSQIESSYAEAESTLPPAIGFFLFGEYHLIA